MESTAGKRLRAGNGVETLVDSNGGKETNAGGERKRRRNRFAETQADPPAPALSAEDDMNDLAQIVAGAKAAAAAQAAQVAQATAAARAAAVSITSGATLRTAAGQGGVAARTGPGLGGAATPVLPQAPAVATAAAKAASAKAATMAALEAQIRASLSSVNSTALGGAGLRGLGMSAATPTASAPAPASATSPEALDGNGTSVSAASKKAQDHTLRLDEHGRQVDADGKLVKAGPVLTLKANRLGGKAHNPYLQHIKVDEADASQVIDPRVQTGNRDKRAKRAFNFVAEGTYIKQGDNLRFREHRKLLSGRMSGRNRAEQLDSADDTKLPLKDDAKGDDGVGAAAGIGDAAVKKSEPSVPPLRDIGDGEVQEAVELEWWDEAFLAKEVREQKVQGNLAEDQQSIEALHALLRLENSKTYKYVQHPKKTADGAGTAGGGGAGAGPGGEDGGAAAAMKVYLTKKERKRIRHKTRMEREREKQDKIALGLIPAPEPKMKIANFMQVLGDQAVVDPSKVEALVMGQVAKRKAEHEARNQAAKLTPEERREKKKKKLLEDTSKELQVAVFRVADMSDPKKRFKVDVNAQQRYLTGGVVMCTDAANPGMNMVVVEGGPKAVRAYVKLMTRRIRWGEEEFGAGDSDSDSDDETAKPALSGSMCELVWQGTVQSRCFNAFRFQECKSPETARRVLEEKGVVHLWDMVVASAKTARESAAQSAGVTEY